MNYQYLPQDELFEYSYNEAVEDDLKSKPRMYTLIKDKDITDLEFNQQITKVCIQNFNLIQFQSQNNRL